MNAYPRSTISIVFTWALSFATLLFAADVSSDWEVNSEQLSYLTIKKPGYDYGPLFIAGMPKSNKPDDQFAGYSRPNSKEDKGEDINWKSFHGKIFRSKIKEVLNIRIVMTDGARVWTGSYMGSEEEWLEVLNVLKTLDLK